MKLNSIFKKSIVMSVVLLFIFQIILFLSLYIFLPKYYLNYQVKNFETMSDTLKEGIKGGFDSEYELISYLNSNLQSDRYMYEIYENNTLVYTSDFQSLSISSDSVTKQPNMIRSDEIDIKIGDSTYDIYLKTRIEPIKEFKPVLLKFFPMLSIFTLILSILMSYLIAMYFSKPIKRLDKQAKDLSEFKFTQTTEEIRDDEIGRLTNTLNLLSTHLKEYSEQKEIEIKKVFKREKDRKDFMTGVTHELKTPVTILQGQTECMIEKIGKYKDRDFYLKENLKEIKRLNLLIEQILISSKVEDEEYKKKYEFINVHDIIEDSIEKNQKIYSDINLDINLDTDKIWCDRFLMDIIISNAISNAYKYTYDKSIKIVKNKTHLIISNACDENVDLDKVKEFFVQGDSSRNTSGHGIGLYVTDKAMKKLKKDLVIKKENNQYIIEIEL